MNGGAYGAGKAGAAFDPLLFIQRPQVILRLVCWLFSIVVFGCIASKGYMGERCGYNDDPGACSFGIGVGVIAFLACMGFLAVDAMFDNFSSIKTRKHVVIGDIAFSGAWAFLWFVSFCYLTDQWRKTELNPMQAAYFGDNLRAAIAFSFFSIFTWAALCYFAVQRFRQGGDSAFAPSYESDGHMMPGGAPFSAYPGGQETEEGYQEPPFVSNEKGPLANKHEIKFHNVELYLSSTIGIQRSNQPQVTLQMHSTANRGDESKLSDQPSSATQSDNDPAYNPKVATASQPTESSSTSKFHALGNSPENDAPPSTSERSPETKSKIYPSIKRDMVPETKPNMSPEANRKSYPVDDPLDKSPLAKHRRLSPPKYGVASTPKYRESSEINPVTHPETKSTIKSAFNPEMTPETKTKMNDAKSKITSAFNPKMSPETKTKMNDAKSKIKSAFNTEMSPETKYKIDDAKSKMKSAFNPEMSPETKYKIDDAKSKMKSAFNPEMSPETKTKMNDAKSKIKSAFNPEMSPEAKYKMNKAKTKIRTAFNR